MVPTAAAAARARFGCSAAHRRWAAFSAVVSGHSVSNRESSPDPSVRFHPLSPSDWMYPGTASTTFGRSAASGNRFSKHCLTRRSSDTAATRVGSRKASASTSPASNKLLNRHSAASVFPDPVSDSAMTTGPRARSSIACWSGVAANGTPYGARNTSPNAGARSRRSARVSSTSTRMRRRTSLARSRENPARSPSR